MRKIVALVVVSAMLVGCGSKEAVVKNPTPTTKPGGGAVGGGSAGDGTSGDGSAAATQTAPIND